MMSLLETLLLYAFTIGMGVILARFLRREAALRAPARKGRGRRRGGRPSAGATAGAATGA